MYDMSLLEVNMFVNTVQKTIAVILCCILLCRPINNVLGFSRETLLAVITNIEGREWKRRLTTGIPENPRASIYFRQCRMLFQHHA